MTPWESSRPVDQAFAAWMDAHGWTVDRYNKLKPYEKTDLRIQSQGGLDETSFLALWGQAAVQQTKDYGAAIGGAATATVRTIKRTAILAVLGVCAVAAIVYNKQIKAAVKAIGKGSK